LKRRRKQPPKRHRPVIETLEARIALSAASDFLQISEIMYSPPAPTPAEQQAGWTDNDEFEFIEFWNSSTSQTLDLSGVQITEGPSSPFSFAGSQVTSLAPGQFALVVRNQAAFTARYGGTMANRIAGQYAGSLSNGGEPIVVVGRAAEEILDFRYNDAHPWPIAADGYGFSLNLIDPASDPNHDRASAWTSDGPRGGSPGAANVATQAEIVFNELLTHTDPPQVDQIELYNPTATTVDIGGWFLSDDIADPQLYTIPPGVTVPPGGYAILWADNDGNPTTDPGPNYFGSQFLLSSVGEDLYLSAGDGTQLTGFGTSVRFDAQLNGESAGRFPNGTGDWYPMEINTFGAPNSQPRVGPLVIDELMYHPPEVAGVANPDLLEFVEIINPTDSPVDLTGWEISGIGYIFPAGTTLAAGQVLVVLPFDPATDPVARAAFQSTYQVDIVAHGETYVGPYSGRLDNGGERVTLWRADAPPATAPDVIPLIAEDVADYNDKAPWPTTADGDGDSLQRATEIAFGGLASSWTAARPTPGTSDHVPPQGGSGDMDFDGDVDFDDVDDFVLGLNDPVTYEQTYAALPSLHGDLDADGDLDFDDIAGFASLLAGPAGTAQFATPSAPAPGPRGAAAPAAKVDQPVTATDTARPLTPLPAAPASAVAKRTLAHHHRQPVDRAHHHHEHALRPRGRDPEAKIHRQSRRE
jgi:hypothetical protein